MYKALTLIDSYGKQTTKDNRSKRARKLTAIAGRTVLNIKVVIIQIILSLLDTMALVTAINSCIFRCC